MRAPAPPTWAGRSDTSATAASRSTAGVSAHSGRAGRELRSYEGNSAPRWHLPSGGGESAARLWARSAPHGVIPRLETRVTSLQRIHRGIACAIDRDGRTEVIEADTVVIATGGFSNNPEMLAASAPQLALPRFLCGGSSTATGGGHPLARSAGAGFSNLHSLWVYPVGTPDPTDLTGKRGLVVRGLANEIWVNSSGRRFHDDPWARPAPQRSSASQARRHGECLTRPRPSGSCSSTIGTTDRPSPPTRAGSPSCGRRRRTRTRRAAWNSLTPPVFRPPCCRPPWQSSTRQSAPAPTPSSAAT